jgi:hypothetical protein
MVRYILVSVERAVFHHAKTNRARHGGSEDGFATVGHDISGVGARADIVRISSIRSV